MSDDDCSDDKEDTSLFGLPVAAVAGIASGCAGLVIIILFFCCKARSKRKREEREYEYYTATTDPQAVEASSGHKRKDSFSSFTDQPAPLSSWSKKLPDSSSTPLPSNQPYQTQPPLPPQLPGRPGYHAGSFSNDYNTTSNNDSSRHSTSSSGSYHLPPLPSSSKSRPRKGIMKSTPAPPSQPLGRPYSSALGTAPGLPGSSSSPFFSALKSGKNLLAPSSPAKSKLDGGLASPAGTAPPPYSEGLAFPPVADSKTKNRFWPFGGGSSNGLVTPNMPGTATGTNVSGSNGYSTPAATPRTYASSDAGSGKGKGKQTGTTFGAPTITVTHPSRGNSMASTRYMATAPSFATGSAVSGPAPTSFGGGSSWQGAGTSYGPATTVGGGSSWHPGAASSYQGSSNYAATVKSAGTSKRAYQMAGPSTVGPASTRGPGGYAATSGGSSYKGSDHPKGQGLGAPSSYGGSSWQGRKTAQGGASTFYTGGSSLQGIGEGSSAPPNSSSFGPKLPTKGSGGSDTGSATSSKRSGKRWEQ